MVAAQPDSHYFTRPHSMPGGARVRLRLARPGDQGPVAGLFARLGFDPETAQLLELIRFDPHARAVLCATALVRGAERVVGFGAVDLRSSGSPATVVAEPGYGPELIRLLRAGLRARAQLAAAA
jgi:hypothetical protein